MGRQEMATRLEQGPFVVGFPGGSVVENPSASTEDTGDAGSIPDGEDPLGEEMATHSSILAWNIPCTNESGGLQFIGCKELDTT